MAELANSTYLDFTSYRTTNATDPISAYGFNPAQIKDTGAVVNLAIVLDRAHDPTELLNADWATRQKTIAQLEAAGTLWSTYGADQAEYQKVIDGLAEMGIPVLGDPTGGSGYVSSAESRTIWVTLTSESFETLFGTRLLRVDSPGEDAPASFWNGSLSLPDDWDVSGIWLDTRGPHAVSNLAGDVSVELPQGPQGIGNSSSVRPSFFAQRIGEQFYNFPALWAAQQSGTIGLIEPGVGSALPSGSTETFAELLNAFRRAAGITTDGSHYVQNAAGQLFDDSAGERSLDVGVVASAAPGSRIGLYVGSGTIGASSTFTAYQAAFWDTANDPGVISSSFIGPERPAPGSPFYAAAGDLFIDAALRKVSVFAANGDGGSGDLTGTGIANVYSTYVTAYGMLVGGTAISSPAQAEHDPTLRRIVEEVRARELPTIWQLVAGGMTTLAGPDALDTRQIETVWNSYLLEGTTLSPGYLNNHAGSGGADPAHPIPWYQLAYGLNPFTADPLHEPGRGTPDVAALAGGGMTYLTPGKDMTGIGGDFGTSAATPFWASIAAHVNARFAEIGLPRLGYANDLFYIAAVVAPAAFNDVTIGSNMSSFVVGGLIATPSNGKDTGITFITPTGFGDHAGPGYDLTTGLGSPNAMLLERALAAIGTAQYYFETPHVLDQDQQGGWTSPIGQSLLFQSVLAADADIRIDLGAGAIDVAGRAGGAFAWTSQFAQQSLQSNFSSELVTMFDGQAQGTLLQTQVGVGTDLAIAIGSAGTGTPQARLSSDYGFVDFVSDIADSAVRVARAVAVAETASGADGQEAVVRMRQNGVYDLSVMFYRVDDYAGTIGGIAPGDPAYASAALARAYHDVNGDILIHGAGYGAYSQATLAGVDAGKLIAMRLHAGDNVYYAFAQANESVDGQQVGHLWNYGLNTWGWEDMAGGGDRDYNDLVVQLDFTGAADVNPLA